jgi:hypothetical protein
MGLQSIAYFHSAKRSEKLEIKRQRAKVKRAALYFSFSETRRSLANRLLPFDICLLICFQITGVDDGT